MKKSSVALLCLIALAGCDKPRPESRYELVKAEKGLIRLDRQTGEMVAVNDRLQASLISLPVVYNSPPTPLRNFGSFDFPDSAKRAKVTVEGRLHKGKMQYRLKISPSIPAISQIGISDSKESFSIVLTDQQGYTVAVLDPWLPSGHTLVGQDGVSVFVYEGAIEISPTEYERIDGITGLWRFTAATKQALAESK